MGVVYSQTTVERGLVPSKDELFAAAWNTHRVLGRLARNRHRGVQMSVVHGSVTEHTHTCRSDVDIFAIETNYSLIGHSLVMHAIQEQKKQLGVDIHFEATVAPADWHVDTLRSIIREPLYSNHLWDAMQRSEWTNGEPDERVGEIAVDLNDETIVNEALRNFFGYKYAGFVKAVGEDYEDRDSQRATMQRALELPKSVVRKVEQARGDREMSDGDIYQRLRYLNHRGHLIGEVRNSLANLAQIDGEYTELVEKAKSGLKQHAEAHRLFLSDRYQHAIVYAMTAALDLQVGLDLQSHRIS